MTEVLGRPKTEKKNATARIAFETLSITKCCFCVDIPA
jgi:hypothetical protein